MLTDLLPTQKPTDRSRPELSGIKTCFYPINTSNQTVSVAQVILNVLSSPRDDGQRPSLESFTLGEKFYLWNRTSSESSSPSSITFSSGTVAWARAATTCWRV